MMKVLPEGTLAISVVDSHTGGEPTRVVLDGFPELRGTTLADRAGDVGGRLRRLATAIVDEPRGNEAMVGALLTEPRAADCITGVIFFDRHLVLGMCGHGTIGLAETLRRMGRIDVGEHRFETPVGVVPVQVDDGGLVSIENVPSHRIANGVTIEVPALGRVTGDIAYGGNTFFLLGEPPVDLDLPRGELLRIATDVLDALHRAGHVAVDHVELFGPPTSPEADARNFVLCPSGTYDRSPCGTGTSAKVAVLAADGALAEGEPWVQESITGSRLAIRYRWLDRQAGTVLPTITGSAALTAEATLFVGPQEWDGDG
jgi:proline racemase